MSQLTEIRAALDTVSACALDDDTDVRRVIVALMKALHLHHWELVEEVLDSPHCLHCDCAGNLYPTTTYMDPHLFAWRCDDCQAYTVVDVGKGRIWTEPETYGA